MILGQIEDREAYWNRPLRPLRWLRGQLPILFNRARVASLGIPRSIEPKMPFATRDDLLHLLFRHIGPSISLKMKLASLPHHCHIARRNRAANAVATLQKQGAKAQHVAQDQSTEPPLRKINSERGNPPETAKCRPSLR